MSQFFCFLFVVLQTIPLLGQSEKNPIKSNVNFQKFSKKDGLPSSKISTIFEDSKGYIWIGTYAGVSRFDGETFHNFSNQEERTVSQINQIIEIKNYRIITLSSSGTINIIYKNRVIKKIENDRSKYRPPSIFNLNENVFITVKELIDHNKTIIDFYDTTTFKKVDSKSFPFKATAEKTKNNTILFSIRGKDKEGHLELYKFDSNNNPQLLERQDLPKLAEVYTRCVFISADHKWQYNYIIDDDKIVQNRRKVNYSKEDVFNFNLDKSFKNEGYFRQEADNHLLFIDNSNKVYDFGDLVKLHKTIFIDSQQRFWVCSESALYLFPSIGIQTITLNLSKNGNDEIWSMTRKGDAYYFSSYVFGLFKADSNLENKTRVKTNDLIELSNIAVLGATRTSRNGLFLPHYSSVLFIDDMDQNHIIDLGYSKDVFSTAIHPHTKDLYFSSYLGIYRLNENDKTVEELLSLPHEGVRNILDIDFDNNNNLIAVGSSGMLLEEKNGWRSITSNNAKGVSLSLDPYGSTWLGSKQGLSELTANKTIKEMNFGFPINWVTDLHVYKNDWLIIGSFDELIFFNLKRYHEEQKIEFCRYSLSQYLTPNEGGQNNFFEDIDGSVWWPMNGKLVKFHPGQLIKKQSLPTPTIFGVSVHGENKQEQLPLTDNTTSFNIHKKNRELTFQFAIPFVNNRDIVKYRARLVGLNEIWESIDNPHAITYRNIPPGRYTFEIQTSFDGENWTQSTMSNALFIGAYFYETIWFKSLIGILILLVFYYFLKKHFQEKQKELEIQNNLLSLQQDLHNMELSYLNTQLDPHEIKNLLASISNEIQVKAPNSYRKMLKLLNITKASLNNTSMTESAKVQLQQVDDYLSLKQSTLSVPFKYSIENNLKNVNTPIPRLMLKNLVENAIKHGIRKNDKGGIIKVVLSEENQQHILIVDDTGKGRDTHFENGIGTSTYQNLFKILNKKNTDFASFKIIDKVQGTRVEVRIPVNYKYQ